MKPIKIVILAALVFGLSACAQSSQVSRNEPLGTQLVGPAAAVTFNVQDVRISVPETLSVSEANIYYPSADIVWREDVYGQRHQQVQAIFQQGMERGATNLTGNRAVLVNIEVTRFHSLTERARYTVGGVHAIKFIMTLRDAQTGVVIGKPRNVDASLKAYGGKRAVAAEHRGVTQKVRITAHLAEVIQTEVIRQQTGVLVEAAPIVASE